MQKCTYNKWRCTENYFTQSCCHSIPFSVKEITDVGSTESTITLTWTPKLDDSTMHTNTHIHAMTTWQLEMLTHQESWQAQVVVNKFVWRSTIYKLILSLVTKTNNLTRLTEVSFFRFPNLILSVGTFPPFLALLSAVVVRLRPRFFLPMPSLSSSNSSSASSSTLDFLGRPRPLGTVWN